MPIAPEGTGDILDTDEARLIVLNPRYPYRRNGEDGSPALAFAQDAVAARSAQRRHRNQLVFLAPDARRLEELEEAVREHLAWKDITGRVKQLDLTPNQVDLATTRLGSANDVTEQRISTTYIWVIYPYQPDPSRPLELSVIKAESQSPELALRVSEKLNREGALAAVHSSRNIHHYLAGPLKAVWERGYVSVGNCGTCTPPTPTCRACGTGQCSKPDCGTRSTRSHGNRTDSPSPPTATRPAANSTGWRSRTTTHSASSRTLSCLSARTSRCTSVRLDP